MLNCFYAASDEEEESEPSRSFRPPDRCLVGKVPRSAGTKPGRGGGVAIIVRKNVNVSIDMNVKIIAT